MRIDGHEVDLVWRDAQLIVEIDGYAFHSIAPFVRARPAPGSDAGGAGLAGRSGSRGGSSPTSREAVVATLATALAA